MKIINRLKQIAFPLGMMGLVTAILFSSLTFGLGAGWYVAYKDNKFFPLGMNRFQDDAFTFFFVSLFFLLFVVILRMSNKLLLNVAALLPLLFIIHQSRLLILSRADGLPSWVTEYSSSLSMILYGGVLFLVIAIILLILQLSSIWLIYRTPIRKNP